MSKTLTLDSLSEFYGTECWYRYTPMPAYLYTDGIRHVAEAGQAYWLIDAIFSHQLEPAVKAEEFQQWILTVHEGNTGTLVCEDGNGNEITRQELGYCDFPLPSIKLWLENKTLYLPSER